MDGRLRTFGQNKSWYQKLASHGQTSQGKGDFLL